MNFFHSYFIARALTRHMKASKSVTIDEFCMNALKGFAVIGMFIALFIAMVLGFELYASLAGYESLKPTKHIDTYALYQKYYKEAQEFREKQNARQGMKP